MWKASYMGMRSTMVLYICHSVIQWHMLGIYANVAVKHDVKRVVCGHVEYYASVLWSCRVVCCCMVLEYGDMPPRNNASI